MINEKALKMINDTIEGIKDTGSNQEGLDEAVRQIIEECYDTEELEENEEKKAALETELAEAIEKDDRIQYFSPDIYAYAGQIKNLREGYYCDSKYDNPFEAMEQEF